jgi:hypothetical protein
MKSNLKFNHLTWKDHSALGEQGTQGNLTIGNYELSVVAGEGLYCTKNPDRDGYKPNNHYGYLSFEVAVFKDTDEDGQEMTSQFFYGDLDDGGNGVLGWKSERQINDLIQRIENSLKTIKKDFNIPYQIKEVTDEFKAIEKDLPKEALSRIRECAESGLESNEEQEAKYQEFLDAGWTKDNCRIEKTERETEHSFIIGDTKYIITVHNINFDVQVKFFDYVNNWNVATPFLQWKWTVPRDAYSNGYSSRKNGKYTSYSIVQSERQYSAKGLLKKVAEVNETSQWNFDAYIKQRQSYNKAKDMLEQKYPDAKVVKGYTRYDHSWTKIDLVFKSGSKLKFDVYDYNDKLVRLLEVEDKHKLSFDNWEGWADRFNNQFLKDKV